MAKTILITATYPDGKVDEQYVHPGLPENAVQVGVGHGPLQSVEEEREVAGVKLEIAIYSPVDEETPEPVIETLDISGGWKPKVGDGCHCGTGGDAYPYTVRRVSPSGKTIWVSRDNYKVKPGKGQPYAEGAQDTYFYPQDIPDTQWGCYRLKKDGRYRAAGKTYRGQASMQQGRVFAQNPHF